MYIKIRVVGSARALGKDYQRVEEHWLPQPSPDVSLHEERRYELDLPIVEESIRFFIGRTTLRAHLSIEVVLYQGVRGEPLPDLPDMAERTLLTGADL